MKKKITDKQEIGNRHRISLNSNFDSCVFNLFVYLFLFWFEVEILAIFLSFANIRSFASE